MKKKTQKQQQNDPQEVKVKVKYKRSIWSVIKFILGIAFIGLIIFFLLGVLSMCDSKIKVPWSGWFENPFGFFETENEKPQPEPEDKPGDTGEEKCLVEFYSDGHLILEIYVDEGGMIGDKMPPDPVRVGYTFIGWVSDQGAFAEDTIVFSNMTVYALFEPEHVHTYIPSPVDELDEVGHKQVVYRCSVCGDEWYRSLHDFYLDPEAATGETDEFGHEKFFCVCRLCDETVVMLEHVYVDGVCSLCGEEEDTCEHEVIDGVCTICGKVFDDFHDLPFGETCDSHVDENDDGKCDNCGADMPDVPDVPCDDHVDENGDGKCDKCGADMSEEPEPPHVHTFSEEWTSDERGHWHAATCGHDAMSGFASHDFVGGVCSVCGYVAPHEHTFSEEWTSDERGHWHAATCGHDATSDFAAHKWNGGEVVKEPTCTTEGERLYTCTVCGYERTESIATTAHDLSYSYDENGHWQECADCGYETSTTEHDDNDGDGVCDDCGWEMSDPCDDFYDSDADGKCDNCGLTGEAHWNGARPDEYQNNGAYAPSILQSQGLGYDPEDYDSTLPDYYSNQGWFSTNCYVSEEVLYDGDEIISFSELVSMELDFKVNFVFDVGVMNWFFDNGFSDTMEGTLMLFEGGSLGYPYTLAFDFDVPSYFREYFGFSSLILEGPYLDAVPVGLSYSIENGGRRLVGELGLTEDYLCRDYPEIFLNVRVYMGLPDIEPNIEFVYEDGSDVYELPYTAFVLGPNARDEILLYVAVPGNYRILGIGYSDWISVASSDLSPFSFACLYLRPNGGSWIDYFNEHGGEWEIIQISFTDYAEDAYRDEAANDIVINYGFSDGSLVETMGYDVFLYSEFSDTYLTDTYVVTICFAVAEGPLVNDEYCLAGFEVNFDPTLPISVEALQYGDIGVILTLTIKAPPGDLSDFISIIFDVASP